MGYRLFRIIQTHFAVAFRVVAPIFANFDEEEEVDGLFQDFGEFLAGGH